MLTLFAYNDVKEFMVEGFGLTGALASPFWFVLEGAIVGVIIGYFATRFGGEGKETIQENPKMVVTSS